MVLSNAYLKSTLSMPLFIMFCFFLLDKWVGIIKYLAIFPQWQQIDRRQEKMIAQPCTSFWPIVFTPVQMNTTTSFYLESSFWVFGQLLGYLWAEENQSALGYKACLLGLNIPPGVCGEETASETHWSNCMYVAQTLSKTTSFNIPKELLSLHESPIQHQENHLWL